MVNSVDPEKLKIAAVFVTGLKVLTIFKNIKKIYIHIHALYGLYINFISKLDNLSVCNFQLIKMYHSRITNVC